MVNLQVVHRNSGGSSIIHKNTLSRGGNTQNEIRVSDRKVVQLRVNVGKELVIKVGKLMPNMTQTQHGIFEGDLKIESQV